MRRFLKPFPTSLDMEIFYLVSNIWWFVVFIAPKGYFSGITYDRALYYLGKPMLLIVLGSIVAIGIAALFKRSLVRISLSTGPFVFLYFGFVSVIGPSIALNALILFAVAALGAYRLLSYTHYATTDATSAEAG